MYPQKDVLHDGYRHAQLANSNYELASARGFCETPLNTIVSVKGNLQNGYRRALLAKYVYELITRYHPRQYQRCQK